jgi:phosphoribosylaminoimidazolecarboxamide formyltransferase/IMP cyclohydrolase
VLSVYDKAGIVEFARGLSELGYQIVSTGGTARKLREAGVEVTGVSDVTGFPGRCTRSSPAAYWRAAATRAT